MTGNQPPLMNKMIPRSPSIRPASGAIPLEIPTRRPSFGRLAIHASPARTWSILATALRSLVIFPRVRLHKFPLGGYHTVPPKWGCPYSKPVCCGQVGSMRLIQAWADDPVRRLDHGHWMIRMYAIYAVPRQRVFPRLRQATRRVHRCGEFHASSCYAKSSCGASRD